MHVTTSSEHQGRPILFEVRGDEELAKAQALAERRALGLIAAKPLVTGGPGGGRQLADEFTIARQNQLAPVWIMHEAIAAARERGAALLAFVLSPREHENGALLAAMSEIRDALDRNSERNKLNSIDGLSVVERRLDESAMRDFFAALEQGVVMGAEGSYRPVSPLGPGGEYDSIMNTAILASVIQEIPDWRTT